MHIDMQDLDIKARRRARRGQRLEHGSRTTTKVMDEKKKKREKYKHDIFDDDA